MVSISYYFAKLLLKVQIPALKDCQIDKTSHVAAQCHLVDSVVGRYSDVGYNCQIVATSIGSFCSLGANVRIGGAAHPMDRVSTSQVFIDEPNSLKVRFTPRPYNGSKKTVIGNDVWIGDNVLVKGGIQVGTGAVLGMGSVVTKDVPPYAVVAGNPAKIIRHRFGPDIVEALLQSEWWTLPEKELEKAAQSFSDPRLFIESRGKRK